MSPVNHVLCYWSAVADDRTHEAVCTQVARVLREARQRRGFSMTVLAQRAGLSQAMISFVERELRKPTLDTLLRIARALDLDLADVLRRASRAAADPKPK